mmetsp:Transcript_39646/g.114410  ORF Transcript_39646/g.114410 Transcript_39646/m.114410 type:complete len:255 (-) Transcript_39646:95-859(-)
MQAEPGDGYTRGPTASRVVLFMWPGCETSSPNLRVGTEACTQTEPGDECMHGPSPVALFMWPGCNATSPKLRVGREAGTQAEPGDEYARGTSPVLDEGRVMDGLAGDTHRSGGNGRCPGPTGRSSSGTHTQCPRGPSGGGGGGGPRPPRCGGAKGVGADDGRTVGGGLAPMLPRGSALGVKALSQRSGATGDAARGGVGAERRTLSRESGRTVRTQGGEADLRGCAAAPGEHGRGPRLGERDLLHRRCRGTPWD